MALTKARSEAELLGCGVSTHDLAAFQLPARRARRRAARVVRDSPQPRPLIMLKRVGGLGKRDINCEGYSVTGGNAGSPQTPPRKESFNIHKVNPVERRAVRASFGVQQGCKCAI